MGTSGKGLPSQSYADWLNSLGGTNPDVPSINPPANGGDSGAGGGAGNDPWKGFNPDNFFNMPGPLKELTDRYQSLYRPTHSGPTNFDKVFGEATSGTLNNFNTAADRIRQRLNTEGNSQRHNMQDQMAAGGNFGFLNNQFEQSRGQEINAFGDAMVGLADKYEGQRQTGLKTALDAALGAHKQSIDNSNFNYKLQQGSVDALLKAAGIKAGQFDDILRALFPSEGTVPITGTEG